MNPPKRYRSPTTTAILTFWLCFCANWVTARTVHAYPGAAKVSAQVQARAQNGLGDILEYISKGWDSLTRTATNCTSVSDPKAAEKSVLYLPAGFPTPQAVEQMEKNCAVQVLHLPSVIEQLGQIDAASIRPPGLLYLEQPYVVPGGRFNEMYGWDSYFIIRGLLRDGKVDLARGMVENFLFEQANYGGFLNANRTYYLTRSQPPFLTSMILAVDEAEKSTRLRRPNTARVARKGVPVRSEGLQSVGPRAARRGIDWPFALLRFRRRSGAGNGGRSHLL